MQPKKPRFNPLILALALAAVLMVWSVLGGGSSSGGSSSMVYSTAVQYFENLQVTKFTLDLNTGVLTMTLKEGKLALPDPSSVSTVQSTGGLLSGMLSSSSSGSTGAEKNSDGTVTVRYKLPYASMFVKNVDSYIAAYDEANPDAPMEYDYTPLKESIPWMEILFYLAMLGCTGFLLFSMMRGGGAGGAAFGKVAACEERPDEGRHHRVARAGGVAHLGLADGFQMCLALLRGKHAVAAERQEHALHALIEQRLRGLMERCIVCDLHAGEELCFNAVGFERVDVTE